MDRIKLCPKCRKPAIFTFAMAYKEFGCVECNVWGEFLGSGFPEVDATPELLRLQRQRKKKWDKDLDYIAAHHGGATCVHTRKPLLECDCKHHKFLKNYKPKYWKKEVI